jgi:ADP-heptose:LPS heptosyltransferase
LDKVVGYGDAIMATARVRGFHTMGRLAAFGDGKTIRWTGYCEDIFKNNPNIARPGAEGQKNLVWFPHYKKNLEYCKFDGHKYVWNYAFKARPGEIFFDPLERMLPPTDRFIVIEPNVAWQRMSTCNKDWGEGKYERLAKILMKAGYSVVQLIHGNSRRKINGAYHMRTSTFHQAIGIMSQASLIIAPEGGNHHAAAAVNVPAIILWGGWSPTQTMGYEGQIMLTGGSTKACGNTFACPHCQRAFDNISVEEVYQAAIEVMR